LFATSSAYAQPPPKRSFGFAQAGKASADMVYHQTRRRFSEGGPISLRSMAEERLEIALQCPPPPKV
jgi:hypothetical protein